MTKKSQRRIQRDIAEGKRKPNTVHRNFVPGRQSPMKPSADGGFTLSAADRILSECYSGLGVKTDDNKKNTCWDDLEAVYGQMAAVLLRHTKISEVLADVELMRFIAEPATFRTNINQFASDLRQMSDDLQKLRALHVDKKGGSTDADELLHSIHIFEQYNLWMERHDGVVMPTVYHILEATNQAELARASASGQLDAEVPQEQVDPAVLDVNQVTDVTFGDENVGQVVGVPEKKSLRGESSAIYQIDEALFQSGTGALHVAQEAEQPA